MCVFLNEMAGASGFQLVHISVLNTIDCSNETGFSINSIFVSTSVYVNNWKACLHVSVGRNGRNFVM